MKKLLAIFVMVVQILTLSACDETDNHVMKEPNEENNAAADDDKTSESMNIKIIVGDKILTAEMEDNAAGRDFISRLPLDVTLNDFNNTTEKIFYPEPELKVQGVKRGCSPVPGDITIYVPWGNVAIFCKSWSFSNDLIKIGHINDDGISSLAVSGDVPVRIEAE